jgi:hypothetical protein
MLQKLDSFDQIIHHLGTVIEAPDGIVIVSPDAPMVMVSATFINNVIAALILDRVYF